MIFHLESECRKEKRAQDRVLESPNIQSKQRKNWQKNLRISQGQSNVLAQSPRAEGRLDLEEVKSGQDKSVRLETIALQSLTHFPIRYRMILPALFLLSLDQYYLFFACCGPKMVHSSQNMVTHKTAMVSASMSLKILWSIQTINKIISAQML